MHIVIDARFFSKSTGGIGRYTQSLIRELRAFETGHRYTVLLLPASEAEWKTLIETSPTHDTWERLSLDLSYYSLAEQVRLPGMLARLRPDLVHFTNFNHPLAYFRPFVTTIHDLTILKYPVGASQTAWWRQAAFRLVLKHAALAGRGIITVSKTSRDDLVDYLSLKQDTISVIYEGIDADYQAVSLPQRGRIQQRLAHSYGLRPPYILFVSQWRPHKGIETLIEAYELLRDREPRLQPQLVVAGRAHPQYPEIPRRIEQSRYRSDIITPGFVPEEDLPLLYQAAEMFAFPSEYEGFGLTPLEALACGVPVIASRASSLPEILGSAALYAPAGEASVWADELSRLLKDHVLWKNQRAAGMQQARQYSWKKMAKETLALYEASVRKRGS